jgi:hypothetical protein
VIIYDNITVVVYSSHREEANSNVLNNFGAIHISLTGRKPTKQSFMKRFLLSLLLMLTVSITYLAANVAESATPRAEAPPGIEYCYSAEQVDFPAVPCTPDVVIQNSHAPDLQPVCLLSRKDCLPGQTMIARLNMEAYIRLDASRLPERVIYDSRTKFRQVKH